MNRGVLIAVCAAWLNVAATASHAAPVSLVSFPYAIGTLTRALQFMGDGSVRVACDGSVLVACDGSVLPVPGASVTAEADGSVRPNAAITLFGDGSVRAGDGSVMPGQDVLVLNGLFARRNPLLDVSLTAVDVGDATTFGAAVIARLTLGANGFAYALSGGATLEDATGDGVSMGVVPRSGLTGLVFGLVDGIGVAALGSDGLAGAGSTVLAAVLGSGTCLACGTQALVVGFAGSGGGDRFATSASFDLTPVPAPAPLGMLAVALAGLALARRPG